MGLFQEWFLIMPLMLNIIKTSSSSHLSAPNIIATREFGARLRMPNTLTNIQVENNTVYNANTTQPHLSANINSHGMTATSKTDISEGISKRTENTTPSVEPLHMASRYNQRRRLNERRLKSFQRTASASSDIVKKSAPPQITDHMTVEFAPRVKPTLKPTVANSIKPEISHKGTDMEFSDSQDLINSDNTRYSQVEPNFWTNSKLNSSILVRNFKSDDEEIAASRFASLQDKFKKDATFFFTHVGPHSFEYRAMFQHGQNEFHAQNDFKPFSEFPGFPRIPFPQFPSFPEIPEIFSHKAQFPELPPFQFPTSRPPIKRILHQPIDEPNQLRRPALNDHFDDPFKQYDVVLGDINSKYPKIFRFNEERINIENFDKQKKLQAKLGSLNSNDILEPENVKRGQMLILHGGIFTVQEPPLYSRNPVRKKITRQRDIYRISNPQNL